MPPRLMWKISGSGPGSGIRYDSDKVLCFAKSALGFRYLPVSLHGVRGLLWRSCERHPLLHQSLRKQDAFVNATTAFLRRSRQVSAGHRRSLLASSWPRLVSKDHRPATAGGTDIYNLGKAKLNFDPRPTSDSTVTVPPCCSTTSLTKASPSPVDSSSFS